MTNEEFDIASKFMIVVNKNLERVADGLFFIGFVLFLMTLVLQFGAITR